MNKRKIHKKIQKMPTEKCCKINLTSIDHLSTERYHPTYTKKICCLINEGYYQRIFRKNQLNTILNKFYRNENLKEEIEINLTKKLKYLEKFEKNIKLFATKIKQSINNDIVRGKRSRKKDNNFPVSNFQITPIKLFQRNLLEKYDFKLEKCDKNSFRRINKFQKIEKNNLFFQNSHKEKLSLNILGNSDENTISQICKTQCKSKDGKPVSLIKLQETNSDTTEKLVEINRISLIKLLNSSSETSEKVFYKRITRQSDEMLFSNQEILTQENASIVTKSHFRSSTKPRLSKENIQGLIRQSITNVNRKKSEQEASRNSFKLIFKNSTTSESHFSESGDFVTSESDLSWKNLQRSSLNEIDRLFNRKSFGRRLQSLISEASFLSEAADDLTVNESKLTEMALKGTDRIIELTRVREHKTLSGCDLGQSPFNKHSQHEFRFDGNYGYIDGINYKGFTHPSQNMPENETVCNETFLALSHMYSLRKLLDRKSLYADNKSTPFSSYPSKNENPVNNRDEEAFMSESSGMSSTLESHKSFDASLIKIFKAQR